jgi:hypothetical protein
MVAFRKPAGGAELEEDRAFTVERLRETVEKDQHRADDRLDFSSAQRFLERPWWGQMAGIAAVCDHCGALFRSGAVEVRGNARVIMQDNEQTCPRCGRMTRIPDGVYDFAGDTVRIIATSASSADSLRRLQRVLQEARQSGAEPEVVARRIEQEAPEFGPLAAEASKRRNVEDLRVWLLTVIAVLTFFMTAWDFTQPRQTVTPELIEQIFQKVLESGARPATATSTPSAAPASSPKIGRNQPCPCGSGKKYKRCHGR